MYSSSSGLNTKTKNSNQTELCIRPDQAFTRPFRRSVHRHWTFPLARRYPLKRYLELITHSVEANTVFVRRVAPCVSWKKLCVAQE